MKKTTNTVSIESLLEANRKLHRRCQYWESQHARLINRHVGASRVLANEGKRLRNYANQLRDEWRETKRSLHSRYHAEWSRLPAPPGVDGMVPRINHTLEQLHTKDHIIFFGGLFFLVVVMAQAAAIVWLVSSK